MTKLIFTADSETIELDLSGDGVILKLTNGKIAADQASAPFSGGGVVESTNNSQWTLSFNDSTKKVFFIGIEDVELGMCPPRGHQFTLTECQINIRRIENILMVISGN